MTTDGLHGAVCSMDPATYQLSIQITLYTPFFTAIHHPPPLLPEPFMDNITTICQKVGVCQHDLVCDILYKQVGEVMPDSGSTALCSSPARFESVALACTICWLNGSALKAATASNCDVFEHL